MACIFVSNSKLIGRGSIIFLLFKKSTFHSKSRHNFSRNVNIDYESSGSPAVENTTRIRQVWRLIYLVMKYCQNTEKPLYNYAPFFASTVSSAHGKGLSHRRQPFFHFA